MHNRWLFWGLVVVGLLAVVPVIVSFQKSGDQLTVPTRPVLPMREWPRAKVVSVNKYWEMLESVLQTRISGAVILPKEPAVTEIEATKLVPEKSLIHPQVCGECHREHWNECQQTAHFRTSNEANRDSIHGHFEPPLNRVASFHPDAWFELVAKSSGFFQQFNIEYQGERYRHEARIDLVIGSGKMGQTYLSWVNDALHELPLSHFSKTDHWTTSPGSDYPEGAVNFARPISERCLDCHATWFEAIPGTFNRFVREQYVLGVTCSRCHGRVSEHIEHHQAHPDDSMPHRIVNPANLRRDQANAVCA